MKLQSPCLSGKAVLQRKASEISQLLGYPLKFPSWCPRWLFDKIWSSFLASHFSPLFCLMFLCYFSSFPLSVSTHRSENSLSLLGSFCCEKSLEPKAAWGGKVISRICPDHSSSLMDAKVEVQAVTKAETAEKHCLLHVLFRTVHLTGDGTTLLHQSIIKEMTHGHDTERCSGGIFSVEVSLFPNNCSLGQINQNKPAHSLRALLVSLCNTLVPKRDCVEVRVCVWNLDWWVW